MPFRAFHLTGIYTATPVQVLVAGDGDVEVQIRSTEYGGTESTTGYDFAIGGADIGTTGGLHCYNGEFRSKVHAGDEIWAANTDPNQDPLPVLTVLVRSR
jgi:hypothetical protein